uniref:Uncharacterized protein n=1 Tax=Tanacetum cinerariifolium TaxID=118510 RepID=A0A6L2KXY6_TANCI|nr:hypothetical protein [Tanacetum cinerariifolium]
MGGTSTQTWSERVLEQPNEPPLTEGHISRSREGRLEENIELTDAIPTPHNSPLLGGYTPGSDEGRITLPELMEIYATLSNKEGKISTYNITRADGSTRRYTLMINLLKNIDREDLKTIWKLVKDKYGITRPEEGYERVLWGDLKVMFEPNIKSEVWRQLQGHEVSVWKLFSSCGVNFVRFKNLHIFLLVDKVYPLTPAIIKMMLERKLQADQ